MLDLAYTGQFKRDYKREKSGRHAADLDGLFKNRYGPSARRLDAPSVK